ncbi:MAG: enoyl-CoA hydratase/isomerase family protein [Archaeoglobi archaeon]|jgi:enoyl-CoA hydratase|nr:enoyl-CoA hydratase-related protein [Archaeoglobi archaeon]TDA25106.1 MAG: enoyl-CoA hydratase/isomerase family protein [Archaeoglobi archaeon]TDA26627.1 MAG: enoyl-CoA hydratase/isomerase family protein [Archaeoglobi archaeon]
MNVLYTVEGNIGIATLNRPEKLNALDSNTRTELKEIVERAEKEVRVLIITGSGRAFAAGADINELVKRDPIMAIEASKLGTELFARIEELEIPVIAAINGLALGGGLELAMACDIRIASNKAKFGQPEINIGIFPGGGGTQRLPRLVGMGMAKKMVLTGEMISAEEAYRIGLVEEIVEPEKLMDRAKEIAAKIAGKSAIAVKLAKKALNASMNTPLREGLRYEVSLFSILFASEEAKRLMKEFLEKR